MKKTQKQEAETINTQLIKQIPLTIEQIKQHVYCPRITYWRLVHKHKFKTTIKMDISKKYHKKRQERAKTLTQKQQINIHIHDEEINLTGIIDIMKVHDQKITPIEIKLTNNKKVPGHHYMQLIAQAYLLETYYKTEIKEGIIKHSGRETITLPLPKNKKQIIQNLLQEIREIIYYEQLPEPTPHENKCKECEHFPICKRA